MTTLSTALRVAAFRRAVEGAGGTATILARGDADSGTVLVVTGGRHVPARAWEAGWKPTGGGAPVPVGPSSGDERELADYCARRRERDPDLWIVEGIVAGVERFAAETIWSD